MAYWTERQKRSKYGAEKPTYNGEKFDSKRELRRYKELELMEKAGVIECLKRQVRFELIPPQYDAPTITKTGKQKRGKLLERKCDYVADFVYYDREKGEEIVEDAKGFRTTEYVIKRKLMLYMHNIRITEV